MTRRHLLIALSLVFTLFCTVLAFRHVPLLPLLMTLKQARLQWVFAMIGIVFIDLFIRALRWKALLSVAAPKASTRELFTLEAAGLAVNNVLFMRMGELARAFLAGRELNIPVSASLSSIAIERALDAASLLFLFILAAHFHAGIVPQTLKNSVITLLLLVVGGLIVLIWAEKRLLENKNFLGRLLNRNSRIKKTAEGLISGAAALKNPLPAFVAVSLSLALWCVDALTYWTGARALGLNLSYSSSVFVLAWAGAASALPAAPGGIGAFEALVENIAAKLGIPLQSGLAFALLTHAVIYGTVTIFGLLCLYRIGFSLTEIKTHAQNMKDGTQEKIHV